MGVNTPRQKASRSYDRKKGMEARADAARLENKRQEGKIHRALP